MTDSRDITTTDQTVSGIDVSTLHNGNLTIIIILTHEAGNQGSMILDEVVKDTIFPTLESGDIYYHFEGQDKLPQASLDYTFKDGQI